MPRALLTINETAAQFSVTSKTVRRWIAAGRITAYRVGPTLIRLDAAEVDALLRPIPTVSTAA